MEIKPRILVVDDVAPTRHLTCQVLERAGWAVEEASDGVQCVERCMLGQPPALVLLDIRMPRMDGIAVLKELRARYPRQVLPIIMVSSQPEEQSVSEALMAGANDYVAQPFQREVLLARVRHQLELRDYYHELQRQQHSLKLEMVSTFAMGVAHNFNNCFGSVLGAAELIAQRARDNDQVLGYLKVIKDAVRGGVALTKKLSAIVTHSTADRELSKEDFAQLLEDFTLQQRANLGERIEFPLSLGDLPEQVAVGARTMQDLLSIIVTNAVDAIPSTGAVRISARYASGEPWLTMIVEDTGEGMDPVVLERVFEPFFTTKNLDRVGGVSIQGNGLGLWNAYHMLRLLGGDIRVESEKGKGTQVLMLVPVRADEPKGIEQGKGAQPKLVPTG